MFLKKLELNGFKSFAQKTTLDFSSGNSKTRGITAVVGPNGSGKSNIADSIRWIMGEQSMKALRGKSSQDIIFAGSGKKARLGSASATLYFDNSEKRIPLDFSEVSIGRKIFRSGESNFFINGSRVRLQDVVDVLAKTGIGKESYSIVTQGMADSVLNATPLERRSLIEDAAGVKQYQIKKNRSVKKLKSTQNNLKRARELSEEIKPHLRMLKRQADKASQSEKITNDLKEKQTQYFSYVWKNYQEESQEIKNKKEQLGIEMMNSQRTVDKLSEEIKKESRNNQENMTVISLERKRSDCLKSLNDLEKELVITEGRIEIEKEKAKSLTIMEEIKTKSVAVDLRYAKDELQKIKNKQEELIDLIQEAKSLDELQKIKELAIAIKKKVESLRIDVEKGKKEEKIENKVPKEKKVVDETELKNLLEKAQKIREAIKEKEGEIRKKEEEIAKERQADRENRQRFFKLESELRKKQFELDKFKDDFSDAKVSLARIEVREDDLRESIKKALGLEPQELEWKEEFKLTDQFDLESKINKLKIKMEQIGGIDPIVLEEYRETKERWEFLTNEVLDLEKAILSLKKIIKEMDQKINVSFEKTFVEINREFTKYFRIIFGGGNAHLAKVKVELRKRKNDKENDVEQEEEGEESEEDKRNFETGIDIFACPPGKRISNLSMLSGGERSLTSLALLFAIISHNPPPFSVLDEVEAALDEANSKRFGRILHELSLQTQFVLITHNRETMRQASLLYGVTMGEDGISKLLSVKLDQVGQGGKIKKT